MTCGGGGDEGISEHGRENFYLTRTKKILTAGNRVGVVVRAILFCAHVAHRTRKERDHGGDALYNDCRAGGGKGGSLSGTESNESGI